MTPCSFATSAPPGRRPSHFYITKTGVFSVSKPINSRPAWPMAAPSALPAVHQEQADAWHAASIANGAKSCENPRAFARAGKLSRCRDPDGARSARCTGWAEATGGPDAFFRFREAEKREPIPYKARTAVYSANGRQACPGEVRTVVCTNGRNYMKHAYVPHDRLHPQPGR